MEAIRVYSGAAPINGELLAQITVHVDERTAMADLTDEQKVKALEARVETIELEKDAIAQETYDLKALKELDHSAMANLARKLTETEESLAYNKRTHEAERYQMEDEIEGLRAEVQILKEKLARSELKEMEQPTVIDGEYIDGYVDACNECLDLSIHPVCGVIDTVRDSLKGQIADLIKETATEYQRQIENLRNTMQERVENA